MPIVFGVNAAPVIASKKVDEQQSYNVAEKH
jgi:hypothetical protein